MCGMLIWHMHAHYQNKNKTRYAWAIERQLVISKSYEYNNILSTYKKKHAHVQKKVTAKYKRLSMRVSWWPAHDPRTIFVASGA